MTAAYPTVVAAEATQDFVAAYFGAVDLGHKSRDQSFGRVALQLSRHPGGTLPDKMANPAAYHAMDRLMNRKEVTHKCVMEAHRAQTLAKMNARPGVVLVVHDTTVLDYSHRKSLKLAPIGNGNGEGYLCHNSLAVDPQTKEVFGLVSQILQQRAVVAKGEGTAAKRARGNRESRLWSKAVADLAPPPLGVRHVDVADRGADLFEFLANEQTLGRDCVVRSSHNRRIRLGHDGRGAQRLLHAHLRTLPGEGRARPQQVFDRKLEAERTAHLRVSCAAVEILPPHMTKGEYVKKPIRAWAVRVWEQNPPAKGKAIEWFLVCLHPVNTPAAAWEAGDWYACRWIVEELHKAMKTGCQVEDLQFHTEAALQPMIGILSVVAAMLLNLRYAARQPDAATRPATEVVAPIYEEVLRQQRYRTPRPPMSVAEFYLAVARLGGHMNRKSDGLPGWLTLWRGWQKLHLMVSGVELDRRRKRIRVER